MADKRRGRPTGTEINDDVALAKIADMLVASPKMKLADVFRAVRSAGSYKGQSDRAIDERWRAKWKQRSETEMTAANKRAARAAQPTISSGGGGYVGGFDLGMSRAAMGIGSVFDPIMEAQRAMDRLMEPMRAAQRVNDKVLAAAMSIDPAYDLMRKMEEQQRLIDRITMVDRYTRWPYV
jgi:hypothetical protein